MATQTTNLSLIKPGISDKIRIANINQNMDIIDDAIGPVGNTSLQSQITSLSGKIGTVPSGSTVEGQIDSLSDQIAKQGNKAGTRITSGSDLDNYTTAGNYYVLNATDASGIGHMPLAGSGRLEVVETNGSERFRQTFCANSSTSATYIRTYTSNGWTNWEQVAFNSQIEKLIVYTDVDDTTTSSGNVSLTNYKPTGYNVPIAAFPITPTSNTYYNCMITYYSGQYFIKVLQSNMTVLASTAVKLRVYWLKYNLAP